MDLVTNKINESWKSFEGLKWAISMDYYTFEDEIILSNSACALDALESFKNYIHKAGDASRDLAYYEKLDSLGCVGHSFQGDAEGWMQTFYLPIDYHHNDIPTFLSELNLDEEHNGPGQSFSNKPYCATTTIGGTPYKVINQNGGLDV